MVSLFSLTNSKLRFLDSVLVTFVSFLFKSITYALKFSVLDNYYNCKLNCNQAYHLSCKADTETRSISDMVFCFVIDNHYILVIFQYESQLLIPCCPAGTQLQGNQCFLYCKISIMSLWVTALPAATDPLKKIVQWQLLTSGMNGEHGIKAGPSLLWFWKGKASSADRFHIGNPEVNTRLETLMQTFLLKYSYLPNFLTFWRLTDTGIGVFYRHFMQNINILHQQWCSNKKVMGPNPSLVSYCMEIACSLSFPIQTHDH